MKLTRIDHPFGTMYLTRPNKQGNYIAVQETCEGYRYQYVSECGYRSTWSNPPSWLTQETTGNMVELVAAFAHPSFGQTRED